MYSIRTLAKRLVAMSFEQFLQVIDGKTTGALRASIGLASTFADMYTYVQFAKTFVDRPAFAGL
jgi:hypothetical protein